MFRTFVLFCFVFHSSHIFLVLNWELKLLHVRTSCSVVHLQNSNLSSCVHFPNPFLAYLQISLLGGP